MPDERDPVPESEAFYAAAYERARYIAELRRAYPVGYRSMLSRAALLAANDAAAARVRRG